MGESGIIADKFRNVFIKGEQKKQFVDKKLANKLDKPIDFKMFVIDEVGQMVLA
jgi:dsDNA-binding SOS-regulon protein